MNKKVILGLSFFLIILIFFNLLINLILPKKENILPKKEKIPTPTTYQISNSLTNNSFANNKNQIVLSKIKPLAKDEVDKLQTMKKLLPIKTDDFEIDYSYTLESFIIYKKTADAEENFFQWTQENNFYDLTKNQNLFIFSDKEVEKYEGEMEIILSKNKESNLAQAPPLTTTSPTFHMKEVKPTANITNVNPTSSITESNQELNLLIDFLKILFSYNYQSSPNQSNLSTTTPFVTQQPTLRDYSSSPSSLEEIFNEVSQRVGVPSKILEAVMRIELPSTFNLTSSEIATYSTPGNYWPTCRPNICSATGPMQMTIGIDKYGSASCSSCCWKGKCLTRCPNAWVSYGNSIINYGGYSHQPNPCNIRDNVYGAAAKIKNDSGALDPLNWTQEQVFRAAKRYYGNCTVTYTRLGNRTYCQYVWDYYQGKL